MNKQLSVYLDLLRFLAAGLVFASHIPGFTNGFLWQLGGLGHEAVVFFFVLSGFVIAFVCFDKKESAFDYSTNRLARIYSVALPGLLLTVLCYYLGHAINPSAFVKVDSILIDPYITFFKAITFTNQSWVGVTVFSNAPYWSLGYEVLYYAFFGICFYLTGIKKVFWAVFIILLMGPSILLYLPIWLLGVACFWLVKQYKPAFIINVVLYIISVVGLFIFTAENNQIAINNSVKPYLWEEFYQFLLEPTENFVIDYILAICVALHIFSSAHLLDKITIFNKDMSKWIRYFSAHTFSLYVYHMPLMFFIFALTPREQSYLSYSFYYVMLIPVIILMLSSYTENKKGLYKQFFSYLLTKLKN